MAAMITRLRLWPAGGNGNGGGNNNNNNSHFGGLQAILLTAYIMED